MGCLPWLTIGPRDWGGGFAMKIASFALAVCCWTAVIWAQSPSPFQTGVTETPLAVGTQTQQRVPIEFPPPPPAPDQPREPKPLNTRGVESKIEPVRAPESTQSKSQETADIAEPSTGSSSPTPVIVRDLSDATHAPVPVPEGHELVEEKCPCGVPGCNGSSHKVGDSETKPLGSALTLRLPPTAPEWDGCADIGGESLVAGLLGDCLPCQRSRCDRVERLFPQSSCGGLEISGWLSGGWLLNGASSNFNGPVGFNDEAQLQLNQAYSILQKRVDSSQGFDLGGRVDVLWGSDYIFTETTGLERHANGGPRWNGNSDYGLALPQAYLEAGFYDLTVKLGHFYTLIGYESVMAPENFFYSHSYTMQYGEPFTHTGMLLSYDWDREWTLHAGLINGWDRLDGLSDSLGFLSGVNYSPTHELFDLSLAVISSSEANLAGGTSDRAMYSLVLDVPLTENFSYVLQHDHGWHENYFAAGGPAEWYGINQYLFYDVNRCWRLGGRFEWFRDDDGARVAGVRPGNPYAGNSPGDFCQIGLGANYQPHANVLVRPELRWDWYDGNGVPPFDANRSRSAFLGGLDVILRW